MYVGDREKYPVGYGLDRGLYDVRFASLSLLHNVDRNDEWCRRRCCAGETSPCHLLMVKTVVKVDLALLEAHCFVMDIGKQNQFYRIFSRGEG